MVEIIPISAIVGWSLDKSLKTLKAIDEHDEYMRKWGYRPDMKYVGTTIIASRSAKSLQNIANLEALMSIDLDASERVMRSFPQVQQQNIMNTKAFTEDWANRDADSLALWTMAWFEGDPDSAQRYLSTAVQRKAINSTASEDINNFVEKSVLPVTESPLIQGMSVAERIELIKLVLKYL